MMERYDAIVIGGGPAGSTCARALTAAGFDVCVMDKSRFPRDKPCAGWITPEVIPLSDLDPLEYARERVFQPFLGFRISRMDGPACETVYRQPVSYGICRRQFDHYLLERTGARVHLGVAARALKRVRRVWQVNDQFEAPMIIGAGGHFCPVARHLGARPDGDGRVVIAQEYELEMTPDQAAHCRVAPEVPELYFCDDLRGYGWCVRKGEMLNVGFGREDSDRLGEQARVFMQSMADRGRIPGDIAARPRGHAYTLRGHCPRRTSADGVLLVGDAAGLAAAPSGEGILPAIESGLLAANWVSAAAEDYSAARLAGYDEALRKRFGPARSRSVWLKHVPLRLRRIAAAALFDTPLLVRRIVLERWFLRSRRRRGTLERSLCSGTS